MVEITQEFLKEHLEYRDGHLWWIKSKGSQIKVGQQWGTDHPNGYRQGQFNNKRYLEHRLVWFYHYGVWPKNQLDHRDTVKNNNEISNLREATNGQNSFNKKSHKDSTSIYKGVSWCNRDHRWRAYYCIGGKRKAIGSYKSEEKAAEAYRKATEHLHKDYANYG